MKETLRNGSENYQEGLQRAQSELTWERESTILETVYAKA